MATTPRPGLAYWLPVAGAVVVAIVIAADISATIPFDSDEANHANIALRQYQDLADGRLADFVRHSYRTGQFPFLHGWSVLPWFRLLGTNVYAARVAQCAWLVAGAAATGWAAWRTSNGDRRAAFVATALFAASPLLATYSGLCMLETPGAAATAIALAVFASACRAEGRRARWLHAAAGLAALATWFVKLNYGLWLIPAVAAGHVVRVVRAKERREPLRDALAFAAVVAVVLGIWYSRADQRAAFMGFLHNPSQAVSVETDDPTFHVPGLHPGNFTAYFGLVAFEAHSHWVIGTLALLCFVWGARRALIDPPIAAAAACLAWTWLVLSMGFREYAQARFIASALPALWIVGAVGFADLLARVTIPRWVRFVSILLLTLSVTAQWIREPRRLTVEYEVGEEFVPVFSFLSSRIPCGSSVLVVGYTDHTSARTLEWTLGTTAANRWRDFNVVGLNSERIFQSSRSLDRWMTAPRQWGDPEWSSWVAEFVPGPDYRDRAILVPETAAMWRDAVARYASRLDLAAERSFPELGLTVKLWRDTAPPPHLGLDGGR
jgi:hypothetical protein